MIIGQVVQSDIQKQYIRIQLKVNPEKVFLSMPCIIEGDSAIYYCIITNIMQLKDERTLNMSLLDVQLTDGISDVYSNLDRTESIELYADLYCLKIIYNSGERRSFKTIPKRLSAVRDAEQLDIDKIYLQPLLKSIPNQEIDPEIGTKVVFDHHGFSFGFLSSNKSIEIPVRIDEMIKRPLSITGSTGSGKTVTAKNIIFRIIGDVNNCLNTRMIIFDPQNEYVIKKGGRKDPGIYDLYRDKVKIITIDPESCLQMNIQDAESFKIFKENITADDVIQILSSTNLSEKMESTILNIESYWYKEEKINKVSFYDVLMNKFYIDKQFAKDKFYSDGSSYDALCRRLKTISDDGILSRFICNRQSESERDTIQEMCEELKSSNLSKKSFVIHFGRFGTKEFVYEFIANIVGRRIYNEYSIKNDVIGNDKLPLDPCVFFLEESHKFIKKTISSRPSVFNSIAREMRKYGLTIFLVDQMPSKLDDEIIAQLNNRIIHRMTDANDLKVALAGLDSMKWGNIVSNLEDGDCLCFGSMVESMPTVIRSFFGDPQEFEKFHGIKTLSKKIFDKNPKNVIKFDDVKSEPIKNNPLESKKFSEVLMKDQIRTGKKNPPRIPTELNDDLFD